MKRRQPVLSVDLGMSLLLPEITFESPIPPEYLV